MEEAIKEKKDIDPPAFAVKLRMDFWLQVLRTDISDEDLYGRLSNYWSVVGSMPGLIAGFTYIASSSGGIEFTQNYLFLDDHRIHIFGLLSMTSFIISLSSAILAASLFSMVNALGQSDAKWFVEDNWWMIDTPLNFCIAGIILMSASAIVSVGGIVTKWVYWTIVAFGVIVLVILFCILTRSWDHMYRRMAEGSIAKRRNDQRKGDLKEAGSTARSVLEEEHKNMNEENEK